MDFWTFFQFMWNQKNIGVFLFLIFFFGLFQEIIRKVECFFVFLTIPIKFLSCWVNFEIEEYRNEALILSAIKLLLQRELGRVSKHLSELVFFLALHSLSLFCFIWKIFGSFFLLY